MARRTMFYVGKEKWNVEGYKASRKAPRVNVDKIVTRDALGRFHGATNFRGTIDKVYKS